MLIYNGPSLLDGAPIVCIATEGSKNTKTGPMLQTWILLRDVEPHVAAMDGRDRSICGTCPHRYSPGTGARTCYVTVFQAPLSVWKKFQRGGHELAPDGYRFAGGVRIGSYGDPGALPLEVVERLARMGDGGWTGYTHAWRQRPDLKGYLMASVDSVEEEREAHALGWRTFRVRAAGSRVFGRAAPGGPRVIECPSERGVACDDCRLCAGSSRTGAASIWIEAHGANAARVGRSLPVLQA